VKLEEQRQIAKRMLTAYHEGKTDSAPRWVEYPTDRYFSEEQARLEKEYVFGQYPLAVAFSCELPGPRSWCTVDHTPTPILLVRAESGQLRAFANVCRHRGMKVASGWGDGARRFTCPFHGWTYDTEGVLVGVPMADGFVDLPRQECGLVRLPVAESAGIVFVRCRPGREIDAEGHLAGLAPELESWGFADLRLLRQDCHHMEGNWKVCWDTFNELYHVPHLHPNTLAPSVLGHSFAIDTFGPHVRVGIFMKSLLDLENRPEDEWNDVINHVSFQYRLLPNGGLTIAYDFISFYQLYPGRTPDSSFIVRSVYVRADASDEEIAAASERSQAVWDGVLIPEDFSVVAVSTRGLAAGVVPKMKYGANEPAMVHLHEQLEKVIAEGIANDSRPVNPKGVSDA
jgi:choline monooxygenase